MVLDRTGSTDARDVLAIPGLCLEDISWQRSVSQFGRPVRPKLSRPFRWEDSVYKFAIQLGWQDWKLAAQDEPLWSSQVKGK